MIDSKKNNLEAVDLLETLSNIKIDKDHFLWSNMTLARDRFLEYGVPMVREEYWKFTEPSLFKKVNLLSKSPKQSCMVQGFESENDIKIVFLNGRFSQELSDKFDEPAIEIFSLKRLATENIEWVKELYGKIEGISQKQVVRGFAALNTAVASEGICIRIKETINKKIVLTYLREDNHSDAIIHNLIKLDPGSSVTVIEKGIAGTLVNQVLEADIGANARLNHVRLQGRHDDSRILTHNFVQQQKNSSFKSFTMTLNGVLTRNECFVAMNGADASMSISGAFIGNNSEHHDDTVFIKHNAEGCESRQVFKKVLKNRSVGVFQGKILVESEAQKTDGYQISKGLLLDKESNFLAKPELEIYADDVICSHGSTCGSLDEDSLFYLTSRGVSKQIATDMLISAFVDEAIQEIENNELADQAREILAKDLESKVE